MHSKRLSQPSATKRTWMAAGLVAALAISACGMTTQNPDDAPAGAGTGGAGTGALAASGTGSSSGGTGNSMPDISAPRGGRAGSASVAGGAGATTPSSAGAPGEIVGGAPSEVVGGAPSTGGAPGSNCATFEEAWQASDCTAVTATELACREICSTARASCERGCQQGLDACSTDCMLPDDCNVCPASAKFCRLTCAKRSAVCNASCARQGTTCRALLAAYPDCPVPPAPAEP